MNAQSRQRFVSEAIEAVPGTADTAAMAQGEPGLPQAFRWRGTIIRIAGVLRTWRETGPCTHGSTEKYVRKHWFEIQTTDDRIARIYFDRQPRDKRRTRRWWLFSIGKMNGDSPNE